ncbi:hypothetical protein Desku_0111 [Desulfofundulus kuznetsovii DSM 6115]|uniref:Uncharacterized protein n=1 Tax=Desulfofundulus kuznetsovii (strain DSM 6115 / VKM B-1805 / 17) TaxID=760568 RepID=A0AAU8PEA5_DESK7|nr:hypothetical protein Desku_0111 [Desulfofundulus kuznetsovii DSM 6115]
MKVTRTGILLLICLLVVAVTAGCASGKKGADAGAGKTVLTMALNQDTGPLDPHAVRQSGVEYPLFYALWDNIRTEFELALEVLKET